MRTKQRGEIHIAVVALIMAVIIFGIPMLIDSAQCSKRSKMMGLESSWGPLQGCMVRVNDRWAPLSYIRIIDGKVQIAGDGEG